MCSSTCCLRSRSHSPMRAACSSPPASSSSPFRSRWTATREHYPELHDWSLTEQDGAWIRSNRTPDGREQTFRDLVFHGGPGSTLEMRLFSRAALEREFKAAGFARVRIADEPYLPFGIHWPDAVVGADGRLRRLGPRSWARDRTPATNAVRVLREHGVAFTHHPYDYEERGGTEVSARETRRRRARGDQDAGDGGRGEASARRADARRPRGVDEEPGARARREDGFTPASRRSPTAIPATRSAAPAPSARDA